MFPDLSTALEGAGRPAIPRRLDHRQQAVQPDPAGYRRWREGFPATGALIAKWWRI